MNILSAFIGILTQSAIINGSSLKANVTQTVINDSISTDLNDIFSDFISYNLLPKREYLPSTNVTCFQTRTVMITNETMLKRVSSVEGVNILGILFYSLAIGIICGKHARQTVYLVNTCKAAALVFSKLLEVILA
ncbi:hypothetical protein Ciccas_010050 [Cichlidogyrus casuarinus]|uniref:Uncharacterized protein n=1 Tax=Cichlidogyrus casuarinus TaxID=1844966 RepID=A0ABD2PWA0_9PLAT